MKRIVWNSRIIELSEIQHGAVPRCEQFSTQVRIYVLSRESQIVLEQIFASVKSINSRVLTLLLTLLIQKSRLNPISELFNYLTELYIKKIPIAQRRWMILIKPAPWLSMGIDLSNWFWSNQNHLATCDLWFLGDVCKLCVNSTTLSICN